MERFSADGGAAVIDHAHLDVHTLAGPDRRHHFGQVRLGPIRADHGADLGDRHGRRSFGLVRNPTPQLMCIVARAIGTLRRTLADSWVLMATPPTPVPAT